MTKRILCLLLILCFLPLTSLAQTLTEEDALYKGKTRVAVIIRETPSTEAKSLGVIPEDKWFRMHSYDPLWGYITYEGKTGYIRRSCIAEAHPLDAATTPPYGVEFHQFIATMAMDAEVTSEKGGGEVLITLHEGAKAAFIGFEDGYGKLIFKRQYGYINSNCLKDLIPVYKDGDAAGTDAPIAAYVSFYNIAENELNIGRMENIRVACEKLSALRFQQGDTLNFNTQVGPYSKANGYFPAPVLVDGQTKPGYGGGTCQVSSTLYNVVLQLPGLYVTQRRAHGPSGASYLPHGVDAAVGSSSLNFKFRNDYAFPVRIDASCQDGALYIAIYKAP